MAPEPLPGRPLALSGPMGVGKSTVARLVGERSRVAVVDIDGEIEAEAGESIASLMSRHGEAAFRALEGEVIARALARGAPCVLALGGGAVTSRETRRRLLFETTLVTLRARPETLLSRMGATGIAARPLLATAADPTARLRALLDERADAYAEAHAQAQTEGRSPAEVAEDVMGTWTRDPIAVPLGARTYSVEIGYGALRHLGSTLTRLTARGGEVLVVSDDRVWPLVGERVERAIAREGDATGGAAWARVVGRLLLPSGEAHKTIASVERVWDAAIDANLDRRGVMLAVGGGVVGDLTGFAAATYLRGVAVVQVPTTLLAIVDASVGGKTAIDRPSGKNLVGAFHQPSAVVADLDLLATLSDREHRSGLAEVAKTALIGDPTLLDMLEVGAEQLAAREPRILAEVARRSVAYKARVVSDDERDATGARATLNFGHTLGHALEAEGAFSRYTHGEAVALGMVAALRIGVALGVTLPSLLVRTEELLRRLELPHQPDATLLEAAFGRIVLDKKREGDAVALVLLADVGRAFTERLTFSDIRRALFRP